jgi:hypothetical protein
VSIVPFLIGVLILAGEGLEAAQGDVGYLQHQDQDIGLLNILYSTVDTRLGVLDEPYSQLSPLSGVAVQARQSTLYIGWNRVHPV